MFVDYALRLRVEPFMSASWSMPPSGSVWTQQRPRTVTGGSLPTAASVVVIGAGVSGLVTAAMLADHGVDVVVVDSGSGLESVSVRSSAKVSLLHELSAARVAKRRGRHVALDYITANQFGVDWIARYVDEHDVDCDWEVRDAVTYVNDSSSFDALDSEADLYGAAGVDVAVDTPREVSFELTRSITAPNQAQFNPAAFLDHIANELTSNGSEVFYGTRVRDIGRERGSTIVKTSAGDIAAGHVVVTTGLPFLDRGLHFARAEPSSSYIVACEVEAPPEPAMYLAADGVKRSIRTATTVDGTQVLLVGGEAHKTGQGGDTEQRYCTLVAWADEHFGVRAVTHRFMAQDYMTGDHMPFAGPITPGNDRVLVATGLNKWGFSNAPAVAAVNIAGIINSETPSWTRAFASSRIPLSGMATLAKANANVATHLIGGWVGALTTRTDPDPGHGHVRLEGGRPVAQSTSCTNSDVVGVDGKCPHLGGVLAWNPAEQTWDCPLHGSRFEADGRLLHGPAVDDLRQRSND